MRIFISGGSKSGKSMHAQRIAKKMQKPGAPLYYLATMVPYDDEDRQRIERHRQEREGWGFETVEVGRDVLAVIDKCDKSGAFLLDSVTALLANEMFTPDGRADINAHKKVAGDLAGLIEKVGDVVIVSDYIYSDAHFYDDLTEAYRRGLANIAVQMARLCDLVLEACCGLLIAHKGGELLNGIY